VYQNEQEFIVMVLHVVLWWTWRSQRRLGVFSELDTWMAIVWFPGILVFGFEIRKV
jgi:hypothetical protein